MAIRWPCASIGRRCGWRREEREGQGEERESQGVDKVGVGLTRPLDCYVLLCQSRFDHNGKQTQYKSYYAKYYLFLDTHDFTI
jgi:hypothetical protein